MEKFGKVYNLDKTIGKFCKIFNLYPKSKFFKTKHKTENSQLPHINGFESILSVEEDIYKCSSNRIIINSYYIWTNFTWLWSVYICITTLGSVEAWISNH